MVSMAALVPCIAEAQGIPLWERLLRWTSGSSIDTPVPTIMMSPHMQMSERRDSEVGDKERAAAIVAAARQVLARYEDVASAERDGYRPFAPRGVIGEEVHYTNARVARREKEKLDLEKPGSILYRRTEVGMKAVGVMYTAPNDIAPEALDSRAPLSIATWHRHVNICGWPNGTVRSDFDGPSARFGFAGSIQTEAACLDAGGYWIPLAFGWMTHVYPNEKDESRVWTGDHMMDERPAEAPRIRE